jgi:hypothetical protein
MMRISIEPGWAHFYDFGADFYDFGADRLPGFLTELVSGR